MTADYWISKMPAAGEDGTSIAWKPDVHQRILSRGRLSLRDSPTCRSNASKDRRRDDEKLFGIIVRNHSSAPETEADPLSSADGKLTRSLRTKMTRKQTRCMQMGCGCKTMETRILGTGVSIK